MEERHAGASYQIKQLCSLQSTTGEKDLKSEANRYVGGTWERRVLWIGSHEGGQRIWGISGSLHGPFDSPLSPKIFTINM